MAARANHHKVAPPKVAMEVSHYIQLGQGEYGHNQPTGGSQYGPPIDHQAAVQNATQHSGGAGDPSLFSTALGFINQNQSQHAEPINEQHVQNAHTEAYDKGKASSLDAGSLGAAAAMQVLKKFTSGGGPAGSGGNSQSQLIGLAMSEASKLFESQGSKSGQKQDAINGAAMTIMKLLVQSKTGPGATNAGGNDLGSLFNLASNFLNTVDHTPRPTAAFFRLLSKAIATLPHLTTLDLAWGFLYRHTHPTWTLDHIGTHRFLRAVHVDGVEDADALERFLARHRPSDEEGGCVGITSFENRSWLDLLDPSSPRGTRVLKQFTPGLLPIAKTFSGPASMLKSMGVYADNLDTIRVWSWGYGSADEELSGIHEALVGNREHASGQENKPSRCGVVNFAYVSKTLVEDVISLVGTYLPDVVHLTIEGYELGKTPLPEKLPYLPNIESITIVARATRPTEKPCTYQAVSYTRDLLGDARCTTSGIAILPLREGSIAQPADAPERQEGYARAWLQCRESNTPGLERITWRPGPKDFHSMGP
ncbi:unnamed protein product [Rhizoctonia solani]|uniref:DUF7721 domain-containing protein n=1 Tax=Rhizoctonia solani TaxID=456999 RepID=A0A8H3HMX0_9AGAM|nr:unnamed protein product [Rhizoctonia solani]